MYRSKILSVAAHLPEKVVTNHDLMKLMDTSHEWIVERTGIEERRYVVRGEDTPATLGAKAAQKAMHKADLRAEDIDFIIFCTLSPDYFFPGSGVLLQRELGIADRGIPAIDIRNQCSGFVYGLSVADQFIRSGMYKNVLLVGSEVHSMGLDYTTRGRNIAVLFGDGAGAMCISRSENDKPGILSTHLHADGRHAEKLAFMDPGSHGAYHIKKYGIDREYKYDDHPYGEMFLNQYMLDQGRIYPNMDGSFVFKYAVQKFPEVILEALHHNSMDINDIGLLIPHQANLRINQFVQKKLNLSDNQVHNNIHKYGNTTAASIPIALDEALNLEKAKRGDYIVLAAFGSGFTWGSAIIKW